MKNKLDIPKLQTEYRLLEIRRDYIESTILEKQEGIATFDQKDELLTICREVTEIINKLKNESKNWTHIRSSHDHRDHPINHTIRNVMRKEAEIVQEMTDLAIVTVEDLSCIEHGILNITPFVGVLLSVFDFLAKPEKSTIEILEEALASAKEREAEKEREKSIEQN